WGRATPWRIMIMGRAPRSGASQLRIDQPIHLRRRAAVERRLLCGRHIFRQVLEGVPQFGVAARLLVGREVALEHAAVDAERLDAGFDIGPPGLRELLRRGRRLLEFEAEAE